MIDTLGRYPATCGMTILTAIGGGNMGHRFAWGGGAVMARETGAGNRSMIDIHRLPASRYMAVATRVGSLRMIRGLAGSGCAVMTGLTGAGDGKMIDTLGRYPATGCMAILTAVGGGNMGYRFTRA